MPAKPRKPLLVNLAWVAALVVVIAIAYIASYPVALRYMPSYLSQNNQLELTGYQTVEWLIDNSALREPIFAWADICGSGAKVRTAFELRVVLRQAGVLH